MSISKKIVNEVDKLEKNENFKQLILEMLEEEAKGLHNFKAKYEEFINIYIEQNNVGVIDDDQD